MFLSRLLAHEKVGLSYKRGYTGQEEKLHPNPVPAFPSVGLCRNQEGTTSPSLPLRVLVALIMMGLAVSEGWDIVILTYKHPCVGTRLLCLLDMASVWNFLGEILSGSTNRQESC